MPDQSAAAMKLWRMDGGSFHAVLDRLSDTFDYPGQERTLTNACYLIERDGGLILLDTGFSQDLSASLDPAGGVTVARGRSLGDQLAEIGYGVHDVGTVILSHYHSDHTGQLDAFAHARLYLGARDIAVLHSGRTPFYSSPEHLTHWLSGAGEMIPVSGDLDLFGDGSVVLLDLPGHTPGHHGLLVRLPRAGPIILCVDTIHFAAQLAGRVPSSNDSRSESLASIDRITRLASNLNAALIATHDPDDIGKLPTFPAHAG